jgi:hypothetical protein
MKIAGNGRHTVARLQASARTACGCREFTSRGISRGGSPQLQRSEDRPTKCGRSFSRPTGRRLSQCRFDEQFPLIHYAIFRAQNGNIPHAAITANSLGRLPSVRPSPFQHQLMASSKVADRAACRRHTGSGTGRLTSNEWQPSYEGGLIRQWQPGGHQFASLPKITKTPKLLLEPPMPLYKINHATAHLLAWPVLIVGFAADRISCRCFILPTDFRFKQKALTGDGQGSFSYGLRAAAARWWRRPSNPPRLRAPNRGSRCRPIRFVTGRCNRRLAKATVCPSP